MLAVRDVVGPDVVGAYLFGSAVLGGLHPRSDVDVFVVTSRPMLARERRGVVDRLFDISGSRARRGPARPVELTVVVQSDVRPWRYPPRCDFQYGEWLRAEFERGAIPGPSLSPDLAPLITMVLQGGRPLFGPPPAEVLDPVPHEDLLRAILEGVPGLLADLESDTANVVLTLARIWTTVETGRIRSKDGAADWALARLPEEQRPVLARARAIYLGDEDRWDDLWSSVPDHADHVIGQVVRASADRSQPPGIEGGKASESGV